MILRMLSNDQQPSSKSLVAAAMALVATGLLLLTVAVGWQVIFKSAPGSWTRSDFIRGFVFGTAIGLEICGVVLATRAARWSKSASGAGNALPR